VRVCMHSSTNSALGHLIMPRSILTHTPSPACLGCRCYTQCGAIEASQVTEATPRGIPWDNSRDHVPSTGVFNDEKQKHGQTRVERGGVRSAEGGDRRLHCSDAAADVWQADSVLFTDRAVGCRCVRAAEVTINAERHFLCSEQHTHARPADERPPC
jgi:hypothetical protein